MSFCGSREGSFSVAGGVLQNKCFVDVMNIIPSGIFLLVSLTILVAWKQSLQGRIRTKTWVHFHCHVIRWLITLLLILVNCIEIAEGFVSDYLDPDQTNYHVVIPPCFSLVASVLSIIFYHNVEMWNSPRFLLVLLPYWLCAGVLKLVKAFSLYHTDISESHLRLWLTWFDTFLYAALLIIELKVLATQRYAFFKKPRNIKPADELANTRYYASYSNFLSRATFWWMNPVLIEGYKAAPTCEKLGKLPKSERAITNYRILLKAFEEERAKAEEKGTQPSLHKIYLRAFWPMLLLAGLFRLIGDLLAFIGPWCIEVVVLYAYEVVEERKFGTQNDTSGSAAVTYSPLSAGNSSNVTLAPDIDTSPADYYVTVGTFFSNGFGLCVILFVSTILQHTLLQNHHYLVIRQGIRLRAAVQTMIYSKALKLSSLTITGGKTTIGQIMNHMTMDAGFLMFLFFFIHYIWATPVQVIIALVLMYFKLGVSAVLGGLLIIVAAPVQIFIGRGMSNMQKKVMQQADQRVKQCNEMIQGIKVIKLLAWESFQSKTITEIRKREVRALFKLACYRAMFSIIGTAIPALATMLTFILYPYLEKEPLSAGKALSTLALFNILSVPLVLFTLFTTAVITANVSAKRLIPYFLASEVEGMGGPLDTMQTVGTLDGDIEMIEMHNVNSKKSFSLARDVDMAGSTCSLASHKSHSHSPTPGHSRQNSTASLLEIGLDHPTHAAALSVGMDHPTRHRHHSGMSDEDDDLHKELNYSVEINDGNFSWDLDKQDLCLKNINIAVPSGKLVIIVGPVGSGKSSLLSAMLGEMMTVSGKVHWTRNPSIAYVSQRPWLLNKTMRENILFGQTMVWKRYQKVIESCALQPDIDMLPAGDATEIGEKGVNLSGGQKQRVSIARALYSHADIFILDDPLSALDAHVGRHVFDDVILKRLLKRKKTVILVTHQLQYLNYAHSILVMKDGEVQYQGRLSEVKKVNSDLYESWRIALKEAKIAEATSRKESEPKSDGTIDHLPPSRQVSSDSQVSLKDVVRRYPRGTSVANLRIHKVEQNGIEKEETEAEEEDEENAKGKDKEASGKLIKKEHQEVGAVQLRIYLYHLRACGIPLVILVLLLLLLTHGLLVSSNYWISLWSSQSTFFLDTRPANSTETFDNTKYMTTYVILALSAVIVTVLSGFVLQFSGIRGAKNLHSKMLNRVLHVPMRFFDTNPSGRILNRFSSDVGQIDQKIPGTWDSFLRCTLATIAAIVVNCIGTPFFIFAAIPLIILYYCLQRFFRATARELQRLDKVTMSPIFSHFSETLSGLQTIRAYGVQARFRQHALKAIDNNILPFLFNQTANRWLGVRLDYMGAVLVFAAAISSLCAGLAGHTDPAFIGLCIAYALMVSNYLNWIVRNSSELEMMMNAVERVDEYTKLEIETTASVSARTEMNWPTHGKIDFRNVSLSYDEEADPVVNCISFTIEAGEKIGICGRTGSGKSSLTLSLFRMIKISEGEILIDDRNISHVSLPDLRSKLAIIPQDPILFTGTIRYNLDPACEIADNKIWTALESVQLKDMIEALPDQLDAKVSEGGENFSIGQKQLFCLARAFLRDNKVLVLDEATASIDLETDNKLQQVIGTVFKDKTVITIAHRISSIMKYDRVMVMESGEVIEFDSPTELMEKEEGYFASLVKQSYR